MRTMISLGVFVVGVAISGCGSSTEGAPRSEPSSARTVAVRGALVVDQRALTGARVIAVSRTNRGYSAALDPQGRFVLRVPAGTRYRLVIANAPLNGHRRVVGHLSARTATGRTAWVSFKTNTDLGTLHIPQSTIRHTATARKASTLQGLPTASGGAPSAATIKPRSAATNDDGQSGQSGQDQQGEVEEQFDDLCGEHGGNDDHQDSDVELEGENDDGDLAGGSSSGGGGENGESGDDDDDDDNGASDGNDSQDDDGITSCDG